MKKLFLIIFCFGFSQGLNTNSNYYDRVENEIDAINSNEISDNLFIWPVVDNIKKDYYDFFDKDNDNLNINPVLALRYGSKGFEFNELTPYPILWISPGIRVGVNKILISSLKPLWVNGWFKFYKHSAYGLDEDLYMGNSNSMNAEPLANYNPELSYGYYTKVKFPEGNGIDFDESIGAFSLLSTNFNLTFGKIRASLGPSLYSNLSLSNNMPAFNQLRLFYNHQDKIYFSFIVGDLFSNIKDEDSSIYESEDIDNDGSIDYSKKPFLPRRIYNHRLDFKLSSNLRVGFYEQLIGMPNGGSLTLLNPFTFYWSEQHQSGDLDNLQIGFDFDWLIGKNRLYGGLLIDEWAPYDTFNSENHNWFATQIGISRLYSINMGYKDISGKKWKKYLKALLKFEYSSAEPQVYVHKFEINNALHHDYPIGLWSGGNSIDRRFNLTVFTSGLSSNYRGKEKHDPLIFDIGWHNTRVGEAIYDEEASLLSGTVKVRDVLFFEIKKDIIDSQNNDTNMDLKFKVSYYDTKNLYSEDKFLDITTSFVYNIRN